MNKRIRELALQAKLGPALLLHHYGKVDALTDTEQDELEQIKKFAELIVQECVSITDELVNRSVDGTWTSNELYTDYNGALFEVTRRIQETFGVEE